MAGNHAENRERRKRRMLLAFVAVVAWTTVEAWRPDATRPQLGPRAQSEPSRRAAAGRSFANLLDAPQVPAYRWLQSPAYASQPTLSPALSELAPPSSLADSTEQVYWCPIDEASDHLVVVPRLNVPDPLLAIAPAEDEDTAGKVCSLHPVWLLANYGLGSTGFDARRVAGDPLLGSLFRPWLRMAGQRGATLPPTRYASPPALLGRSLGGDTSDRLAMIPSSQRAPASLVDSRDLTTRLMDGARPLFSAGLDVAIADRSLAEPTSLLSMLCDLAVEPHCSAWALESFRVTKSLATGDDGLAAQDANGLERLAGLALEAERLAEVAYDPGLATRLRRARYAMWRRIMVWHAVAELAAAPVNRITLVADASQAGDHNESRIAVGSPVPISELLAQVEALESAATPQNSEIVAQRLAQLADSPDVGRQRLAETLKVQYSNANARIAITDGFANRFLPAATPRVEPVYDQVLGTPVRGQATTSSAATISLLPDPQVWRIGLELSGNANSQTVAFERTVRVRTIGTTNFAARQQVVVDTRGIHLGAVVADANTASRFVSARSGYDILPLVGGIVRSKAAGAFSKRRIRAQNEVASKTEARVRDEMERKVGDAVDRACQKWQARVVAPLAMGGVSIEPVEMRTTEQRLIARVRVTHADSLAAHSPRPRAPSDSLASLQLHESSLTNLVSALNLAGQRLTGEEFAERLRRFAPDATKRELDEDAREAQIEFADNRPVTFELKEGVLHVAWEVRELVVRGRPNRNFKVHVYYTPAADGVVARFDHQKGPFLEGNMRNSQRMRLQTIFGKVFPPEGQLAIGAKWADDPRLEGLMITQLVIDDGWLGAALGPADEKRAAQLDRYGPIWR